MAQGTVQVTHTGTSRWRRRTGEYLSLAAALEAAGDGDVLTVAPGTYRENLVVQRAVTLRGPEGSPGSVRIAPADGVPLTVRASAVVQDLLVEGQDSAAPALLVEEGAPELMDIRIVTRSAAGLEVRGGARPTVRRCTVDNPGGIGIAAIQLAKLFGAKVIATASTETKRAACLEEGADHAIDYSGGFVDKVKELTGGRGVDIVYDPIGDKVADESLRCLAWGGRLLILGFLGGGPTNIRSNYLLIKGIDAVGVRIGGLNEVNPALALANMKALMELAGQGKLKPRISHRFRLDQAADALQAVIDRAVIGKAVIIS